MSRDISRNAGNVYEKFDKRNWLVTPKFSEVQPTSFVDVSNVSVFDEEPTLKYSDMGISGMLKLAIEKIK